MELERGRPAADELVDELEAVVTVDTTEEEDEEEEVVVGDEPGLLVEEAELDAVSDEAGASDSRLPNWLLAG